MVYASGLNTQLQSAVPVVRPANNGATESFFSKLKAAQKDAALLSFGRGACKGLDEEEKERLRKKYGSSDLSLNGAAARDFMQELRELGLISDAEFNSYNAPVWSIPKEELEKGYGSICATSGETANLDFQTMDLKEVFRRLVEQDRDQRVTFGKKTQLANREMYERLADLMDDIFRSGK